MWFFLIYIQLAAVQAQNRIALRGSGSPCEGRLEVYHVGQWGLVGHHDWTDVNGKVVCRSLDCGDHVKSGILTHTSLKNRPEIFLMDEIHCTGNEQWLWDCPFNGWKITRCLRHNFVSVVCSGKISLSLNLHGMTNECAGVVQFTTPTQVITMCNQTWNDALANRLCKDLNCGTYQKRTSGVFKAIGRSYGYLQCTGNEDFLWQCVDRAALNSCKEEINIICSKHNRLRLYGGPDVCEGFLETENSMEGKWVNVKCKEVDLNKIDTMCAKLKCGIAVNVKPCNESENIWLKCSDRVKIELGKSMKTPSPCYGEIYINVNGVHQAVCSKDTTLYSKIGELVCRNLQCGTPLSVVQGSVVKEAQISFVDCHGQMKSPWECMHKHANVDRCPTINVLCSGSLDMRLSNGLDECAGQLEVKFFGSWKRMTSKNWTKNNADLVCQHLKCGESMDINQHRFVGSNLPKLNWTLECNGSSISQCNMAEEDTIQQYSVVNILCNKQKLWFLEGSSSCEGKIKDESGGYLQDVTNKWADEVCKRNLCGGLQISRSTACPENATSPFNCSMDNSTISTSTETQDAYVKCSGSMEVRLQHKCHGKVLLCSSDSCGVCADTWSEAQSEMLCKILGCGQMIKETYKGNKTPGVTVASVHCSQTAENFSQCNFVQLKNAYFCDRPAYVSCTGSVKAVLQDPRDKCAGIPKLFFSGALHPLCTNSIDEKTQNGICTNVGCGETHSFAKSISSISKIQGLTRITCPDNNISNCNFSETKIQTCEIGHLKCTDWRRLVLINPRDACKGDVYLQNKTHLNAVSNDSWNNQERNELCKYLECGKVSEIAHEEQMDVPFWSRSFGCPEKPDSIWDCEKEKEPVTNPHQLHINCTEEPEVTLKGTCTGEVWLNTERVCYNSKKTEGVFNELCFEQGCSMLFKTWATNYDSNARLLSCTGNESKLWQCNAGSSHCKSVVSLACANSLRWKFSTECGGILQVNYRGQWEPICPLNNKKDADRICQDLNCGNANTYLTSPVENTTDITINCNDDTNNLMHCFKSGHDPCRLRTVIYCDKYVPDDRTPKSGLSLIIGVVVGLLLLLVAVMIIYWKRKAILAVFSFSEDSDMAISENEMHSLHEPDDYEDIVVTVNPMEDSDVIRLDDSWKTLGASSSQRKDAFKHDKDDESTSQRSSGTEYDDVKDPNVPKTAHSGRTHPLLPSRPNDLLEKVTLEAEVELQEDYDDVMLPQTESLISEQRVHLNIPGPAPERPLLGSNDEVESQKDE